MIEPIHFNPEPGKYTFLIFFSILFLFAIGVFFLVFRPYLYSSLMALILYLATRRPHKLLKGYLGEKLQWLVPWIMITLVSMIVLLPSYFVIRTLISEALSILFKLRISLSEDKIIETLMNFALLTDFITDNEFFWVKVPEIYGEFAENYVDILNLDSIYGILSNASSFILGNIELPTGILMNLFFALLVLFFLYQDGKKVERFILDNLPFSKQLEEQVGRKLTAAVQTVIRGNLIISILQGAAIYILLWIAGISSPFLYASLAAFFSIIPVVGTSAVWLPIGLYILFLENNPMMAIFFMGSGLFFYVVLENFVKPRMLDKKLQAHPLLIFLSLIGGIKEFGIMGLVVGPVTVTLVVILWDFWKLYRRELILNKGHR
ncbi:AI-2E family transporter [Leptospira interrogans]|uniref:AI-2E family transporter n=1 Tax=Leptospira interrogans serovar Pomona TaxID=44276 RepID=A0AA41BI20_LEPIR|nr:MULTISPECIES: AI-2E family transporter [Leptospira]EMN47904.1 PF01594 domain protein [Leptospira interrogans str. L1207]KAA1267273.1 AI-2E family transporter [Leptospira interrogans serovar Weerasinghe]KAA1292129.1 AI-2E family transporter [Leptospira interrogans serovar Geyaweera]EJO79586.1 PF01594 domain protein [Leptospira interrogans serovar Pomona str. Kennewicki LC82-25]EKN95783.1 PF01594 domain protein [Leptospira interrogans serovar Pomona str. Pomona]